MAAITIRQLSRKAFQVTETGVRLEGADTLMAKLDELAAGLRAEILEEGLRAGAEVIRAGAAERASDEPELAGALVTQVTVAGDTAEALIGFPKGAQSARTRMWMVMLGYWREFGTQPHVIQAGKADRARTSRVLKKLKKYGQTAAAAVIERDVTFKRALARAGVIFGAKVQHPGRAAKPFLRPAFDEDGPHAVHVTGQTIWERIRALAETR